MKTKQVSRILAIALSTAALAVYGCGGGSSSGGTGGTTITGATQANSAGASATQTASIGSNTGQSLSNIASIGGSNCPTCAPQYRSPLAGKDKRFNKMHAAQVKAFKSPISRKAAFLKKAKAAATIHNAPTTILGTPVACNDGGTVTSDFTYDPADSSFSLNMTYNDCLEYGERLNGPMKISGVYSATGNETFTITMGDGNLTIESTDFKAEQFMDTTYTTLYAYYLADMSVSGSGEESTGNYSFTMTANGKEKYSDYTEVYNMTFSNLKFVSTFVAPATTTGAFSGTDTVNGGFTESWTGTSGTESVSTTFTSFVIAWSVPAGAAYYEFSADGTVATDFTPDAYCGIEGTWVIDTTTPIQIDNNGVPLQGVMVINSNTTIKFDDPDGSGKVTVTVTGGTPTTYNSINELEATCKMADFEADTTASTTVTSTTQNQTVTGTPSSMVITAKSTFPTSSASSLDCYTDLHVNFYKAASYTTAPTSTTAGTWYVDWHIGLIGVDATTGKNDSSKLCTSPTDGSVNYWEALDLNGDGVCDVGLDIEGGMTDDTDNGIEHFIAKTLPAGYYVVSVNNYSCATDVQSAVSIQVGNSLFEGYNGTYSLVSAEGATDGAWYRVTDIRVNDDGTVNLLAPDANLKPWHTGSFGMAAPMKARGLK